MIGRFALVLAAAAVAGCSSVPRVSKEECALRLAQPARHHYVPTPAAAAAYKRGNEHMARKDYRAAVAEFTAATRHDQNFHAAYIGRGSAHLALQEYDAAVLEYGRSITVAPNLPDGWFARGTAFWMLGNLSYAEGELRRTVELSPEDNFYYQRLARVLYDQERGDEVAALYERAYRANPCREWALAGWLGALQDQPDRLSSVLGQFGSSGPPVVSYYSGWLALRGGDYRAAARNLEAALDDGDGELVPLSAYWDLAVAHRELGNAEAYKKAAHEFYDRTGGDVPGVQGHDVSKHVMRAMRDIVLEGREISSIAFAPDGGWMIVFGSSGFWRAGLPEALERRLLQVNREERRIESVAIGPGGAWAVVYDRNGYEVSGAERNLTEKLRELNSAREHVQHVSLGPGGSWAIVYNGRGYWHWGLPQEIGDELGRVNRLGHDIRVVLLGDSGNWAVVHGRNGYNAHLPRSMLDAMNELYEAKHSIDVLALAPGGGWVVYSKSAAQLASPHQGRHH